LLWVESKSKKAALKVFHVYIFILWSYEETHLISSFMQMLVTVPLYCSTQTWTVISL
jgi:hypothetical protein